MSDNNIWSERSIIVRDDVWDVIVNMARQTASAPGQDSMVDAPTLASEILEWAVSSVLTFNTLVSYKARKEREEAVAAILQTPKSHFDKQI